MNRFIVRRSFLSGKNRLNFELRCMQANPARQKHHTDQKIASIKAPPSDMRRKAWFGKLSNTHIRLDKKRAKLLIFIV